MNLEERQKELDKELNRKIKDLLKFISVTGMCRVEAEEHYKRISEFSESRPKMAIEEIVDRKDQGGKGLYIINTRPQICVSDPVSPSQFRGGIPRPVFRKGYFGLPF